MKQKKHLELAKGIELVAERNDEGQFDLTINIGKRSIELKHDSVVDLRDWLSLEVIGGSTVNSKVIKLDSNDPLTNRVFEKSTATVSPALGLKIENLNQNLNKAASAFSQENLYSGKPIG